MIEASEIPDGWQIYLCHPTPNKSLWVRIVVPSIPMQMLTPVPMEDPSEPVETCVYNIYAVEYTTRKAITAMRRAIEAHKETV